MLWLAGGSLLILAGLVYLLYLESQPSANTSTDRPLKVYCAAALKLTMQAIAVEFEKETGRRVEFEFGDSGQMLGNVTVRPDGDLFLPADDSFIRLAQEKGLVAEALPLCRMRAIILTRPDNPHQIAKFDDLLKRELKVGIANPDKAAIGKVVRNHLARLGKWDALAAHLIAQHTTVTDSANAVQLGSVDAAIVWDVVAANYPELAIVRVPELDGAVGRVELAVLASAPDPVGARRLARYTAASDRGLSQFRKAGFIDAESGSPWASGGGTP
jgi:molybdenum ABC transporter molybdate-binding protein